MNPKQRSRGRGNNGGKKPFNRNQVFDSNGPDGRIRGNAHQVMEKYLALARDASSQGDRVNAENYYQHAEHYFRVVNAHNLNNGQRRPPNSPTPAEDQNLEGGEEDEGEGEGSEAASVETDGASEPVEA